jgi:hypothetical protein
MLLPSRVPDLLVPDLGMAASPRPTAGDCGAGVVFAGLKTAFDQQTGGLPGDQTRLQPTTKAPDRVPAGQGPGWLPRLDSNQ